MLKDRNRWFPPLFLFLAAALFLLPGFFVAEGHALGTHDMRGLFYPWLELVRDSLAHGRVPFWDDALFAGYPFLANPQVAFFYPLTWLAILPPLHLGFTLYLLVHLWLAGWGMYLFVKDIGAGSNDQKEESHHSPFIIAPAFLAALTFMFSGFFAARIYAGHIGLLAVHVWVPWLLLATSWGVRKGGWPTAVVMGIPFGLAILAGHTTSLIYVGLIWGGWALFLIMPDLWARRWGQVGTAVRQVSIAGVVGLLLAGVQLLPLLQLTQAASRTAEANFAFASGFSFPPSHLITLLVPEFFGEPTRAGYWSVPTFEELAAYAGLLPLLILPLALRHATRHIYFFMGLGLFGILLALGSYGFLFEILYELFPPFRLARAPGRAMFLYLFSASVLLGLTLATVSTPQVTREKLGAGWWWWVAFTALSGLTALAATGAVFASVHPTDTSGRLWHQLGGWGLFTAVVLSGGLLLWYYIQPRAPRWLPLALGALIITDLWLFGAKLIVPENMAPDAFWFGARDIIGETDQRILPWGVSIFAQNGAAQVGLHSVFGYNALELGANTALASSVPDPRSTAYDILGAGYVVAQSPLDQFTEGEGGLQFIGEQNGGWVYARPQPLSLVRLVYQAEIIPDQATAISRVHQPDFDPATTAILDSDPACSLPSAGMGLGTAVVASQEAGAWRIQTSSDEPALLVLSETAYPGWQVWVNGERVDWQTAYTAVRAVCIPAGEALVEWRFRPWVFLWGGLLSLLGVVLLGTALTIIRRDVSPHPSSSATNCSTDSTTAA